MVVRLAVGHEGAWVGAVIAARVVVVGEDLELVERLVDTGDQGASATLLGRAAIRHFGFGVQAVEADGQILGQDAVGIQGVTLVVVGAEATFDGGEVIPQVGLLGHAVDRAAGGTAAGKGGTRALGDFDLLQRKGLASNQARVAQTVGVDVAAGFVAADDVAVAERVAAFAGTQGDAGLGAEDVLEFGFA